MLELNVDVKPSRLLLFSSFLPRALPPVTYIGKPMCIAFQASSRYLNIVKCFHSLSHDFSVELRNILKYLAVRSEFSNFASKMP